MAKLQAILTGKETTLNGQKTSTLTASGNVQLEQEGENINIKSSEDVDSAVKWRTNPNLLDNWYFGNPVNQRGQGNYTGSTYSIDRWLLPSSTSKLTVADGYITLLDGGLLHQRIAGIKWALGKTMTMSMLSASGELHKYTVKTPDSTSGYWQNVGDNFVFGIDPTSSFSFVGIKSPGSYIAAKLELGPVQTLAHKEGDQWVLNEVPDYGMELAKCMRYYQAIRSNSSHPMFIAAIGNKSGIFYAGYNLPVPMRDKPTVIVDLTHIVVYFGDIASLKPTVFTLHTTATDNNTKLTTNVTFKTEALGAEYAGKSAFIGLTSGGMLALDANL